MGNIYTSAYLWFRGSWNPAGSLGRAVVQYVRPVPSELGRGGLSRFSVLLGGWMFKLVRRVFRMRPQGVTRTLSDAKRGEGGASG